MPSIEFSIGRKPRSTSSGADRLEHVGEGRLGTEPRQVALGRERLLCEGSGRSQERDGQRRAAARGLRRRVAAGSMGGQDSGPHGRARSQTADPGSARGHGLLPTRPWPVSGACLSPISASPRSTTTARSANGAARLSTRPGRPPNSAPLIVAELLTEPGEVPVLLTRADPEQVAASLGRCPGGEVTDTGGHWPSSHGGLRRARASPGAARHGGNRGPARRRGVPRSSDALTGSRQTLLADCGVAGVHRLLASFDQLTDADAVVVVAGMEGALASLVAGISPAPVVAVPTSAGYGAALEGVTAFLAMLASCAAGLTVVGIDNGFGAATAVARLLL